MACTQVNQQQSYANPALLAGFASIYYSLLCFTLLIFFASSTQANSCNNRSFDRQARVTFVNDGDTVKLANGDRIRLIGVNTPEMNYKKGRAEPYARKAKRFLEKLVLNKKIGIKYGREKHDRYKRKLAHIFLLDGTNIQAKLLKTGLAFGITIPPNLWMQRCYQNSERIAKKSRQGVWRSPYFKPIQANKVSKRKLGFKIVTGTVTEVVTRKKDILIRLSKKMSLRISNKFLPYFNKKRIISLLGKKITASGWISSYKRQFTMQIKHPSAIKS